MQFGKVKDYLSQGDRDFMNGTKPEGARDVLEMPLDEAVTSWRERQQHGIETGWSDMTQPEQVAHSWEGGFWDRIGLPTDGTGMRTMPGPDWRSASLWNALDAQVAAERQRCLDIMKAASLGLIEASEVGRYIESGESAPRG